MKILLVGNASYRETLINKIVNGKLTCRNNVIELEGVVDSSDFLINQVLGKTVKQHVDLIIADDPITNHRNQNNLCEWLRKIHSSFSGSNFRLSSIPFILCKLDISQTESSNLFYNSILPFSKDDNDLRILSSAKKLVREWRGSVVADLETLKIELKLLERFGNNYSSLFTDHRKVSNEVEYYFSLTSAVSKEFICTPQTLDYEWISENKVIEIQHSLEKYEKIVKDLIKYNGKSYERQVLHSFYNRHEFFLTRDTYDKQIHEKRYYVSKTSRYHIPDYILPSVFPGHTVTSISEIKRHNILFEYKPKNHQPFTNYSTKALFQASAYQDDFEDAGLFTNKFQMDLIIGLDDKLTDLIRKKFSKHFSTINVTTHDALMTVVEEYYKRTKSMHAIKKS